nr:MAG TPA: hypothetical protein [Caudoviricetes sp.]
MNLQVTCKTPSKTCPETLPKRLFEKTPSKKPVLFRLEIFGCWYSRFYL